MRYLENIIQATEDLNIACGFAFGSSRADTKLFPFLERAKSRGWQLFPIDMRREIDFSNDIAALGELRKSLKSFSPHIIHCHSSKAGVLGRVASLHLFPRPIRVYSPHAIAAPLGSKYLHIERLFSRVTDRFVAVSDSEREQIVSLGLAPSSSVDVVYPAIDFEYFKPMSTAEAREVIGFGEEPIVVSIGRLTKQKSPQSFVEIIKRLAERHPTVKGIWVGSGEDEQKFRASIVSAGLSNCISVVPWVHDVRVYIAAADVVLSTSEFESFGYVSAEAIAMQRPVVASNVTGTCDIMRGLEEWLYAPGDFDSAAKLLAHVLNDLAGAEAAFAIGREIIMRRFSKAQMRESLASAYTLGLTTAGQTVPGLRHPADLQTSVSSRCLEDTAA